MILAAIGDIHGNLPALEAVLGVIDAEGIHTVVNTGDVVVGHGWSNEVIEIIRDRGIPTVQGETDRKALRFMRKREQFRGRLTMEAYKALEECAQTCRSENLEFLRRLPKTLTLEIDGITIAVGHGTLASQARGLTTADPDDTFRRQREMVPADVFVLGRTHEAYARKVDDALFVNPGSVGFGPTGEPGTASFAIVSTEAAPWDAELRTVRYS